MEVGGENRTDTVSGSRRRKQNGLLYGSRRRKQSGHCLWKQEKKTKWTFVWKQEKKIKWTFSIEAGEENIIVSGICITVVNMTCVLKITWKLHI
jgi:hypothetical protein